MKLSTIAKNILKESAPVVSDTAKKLLFDPALEMTGVTRALQLTYGNTIPLYHATTPEIAKMIDQKGFALTPGRQMTNFGGDRDIIYFQIGRSDYADSHRSVVYKFDAPIKWIDAWAEADMDSAYVEDEEFEAATGIHPDEYTTTQRDFITYFLAKGDQSFDGMELLVTNNDDPSFKFPSKPVRVKG